MINISRKEECCGCNVCGDACPKEAISFVTDNEGFWYPIIDEKKCINCGKCDGVCPVQNTPKLYNHNEKPECYAAEHKSMEVIFASTTGGMFSALAEIMYKKNGYVGGAIHNEDFSASEYISNNKDDLKKLRRSKDLQSNSEGFYNKIKDLVQAGKHVLICGVPCQIAAIRSLLGKEYDNLILVDLICLGVNSPKVWLKYIDYIEKNNGSKIVLTENKSKEYGWRSLTQKFVFENGKEAFDTRKTSLFTKGFIESHLYCRPSCYECRFKGFPRIGDITIGDFWGIAQKDKSYDKDMGTSVVLVNSEKGLNYFEEVKKRITYKKVPLEWALEGNPALVQSLSKVSDQRKQFFSDLDVLPFDEVIQKYSVKKQKGLKDRVKDTYHTLKFIKYIIDVTRLSPRAIYQTFKYSGLRLLTQHKGMICGKNCSLNISKKSQISIEGLFVFGKKGKFPNSREESKLYIGKNAVFSVLGDMTIDSGCDIEVFDGATLIFHGAKHGVCNVNRGLTIICGERIEVLSDVGIGRDVTIRDTNGNHYMNTLGYKPSIPVVIGERVWLCESCTIMPGVKLGDGTVVGANSMVTKNTVPHSLVSGIPAESIGNNILWKC